MILIFFFCLKTRGCSLSDWFLKLFYLRVRVGRIDRRHTRDDASRAPSKRSKRDEERIDSRIVKRGARRVVAVFLFFFFIMFSKKVFPRNGETRGSNLYGKIILSSYEKEKNPFIIIIRPVNYSTVLYSSARKRNKCTFLITKNNRSGFKTAAVYVFSSIVRHVYIHTRCV